MTKQAHLPDGTVLEFPDDTPDDVMDRVVKTHLAPAARNPANASDFAGLVSGQKQTAPTQDAESAAINAGVYGPPGFINAGRALFHHLGNLPTGIGQLEGHAMNGIASLLPDGNAVREWMDRHVRAGDKRVQQREQQYQANVPDSAASYAGATAGEVAPWMVGGGELRAAGLLPRIVAPLRSIKGLAQRGAALATEGGLMGLSQPVTGDGDYGGQKTAQTLVGAASAPVLAGTLGAAVRGVQGLGALSRYLTPAGQDAIAEARLARIYPPTPENIAGLRQPSGVAGFDLTPAQALPSARTVQAERVLRNSEAGPAFADQDAANNAALHAQVSRVAGSDADLAAAQQARREGPGAFWRDNLPRGAEEGRYGRAQAHLREYMGSRNIPMPEYHILDRARLIAGQVERGSISMAEGDKAIRALAPTTKGGKKALEQALGLIDGGMVDPSRIVKQLSTLSRDTNPRIAKAANEAISAIAKNQDGMGWVHARVLDGLRQNWGTMIADASPHGAVGSAEGATYGPLAAKITHTLDRAIPGYRNNLAAYASASQPINDMVAARALLDAINSGGRDVGGNQNVTLNQVRAMLSKDNRAHFPMSDSARQQLEAVLEVLQKRSVSNNTVAASGPATAADLRRAVQGSPLLMRMLGHLATVTGAGLGHVATGGILGPMAGAAAGSAAVEGANAANNAVVRRMGERAVSAPRTADALESYLRSQKPESSIWRYLLPYDPQRALPPPRP